MSTASDLAEVTARFERALLSLDRVTARRILVGRLGSKGSFEAIEPVIVRSLEQIGEQWEQGQLALSQVYMSGSICEWLVDRLIPPGTTERRQQPSMAIAVLEDHHQLGKRIVYSSLRANGFELLDYGNGVSVEQLVERVMADCIEVLLISMLMLPSALRVQELKRRLDSLGSDVKLLVGGAPFRLDRQLWQEVGADAMGVKPADAITIITRWMEQ